MLLKMKQAGCYRVTFGVESASRKTQKYIGKIVNLDRVNEIIDYVGGTTTATIANDWAIIPDSTSNYIIHQNSGKCGEQAQDNAKKSIKLKSTDSAVDDFYNHQCLD